MECGVSKAGKHLATANIGRKELLSSPHLQHVRCATAVKAIFLR